MKHIIVSILSIMLLAHAGRAQQSNHQDTTRQIPLGQQGWVRQDDLSGTELGLGGLSAINKDTVFIGADGVGWTTDGGVHWKLSSLWPAGIPSFVDRLNGISVGYDASPLHVYHTSDGGQHWDTAAINMVYAQGMDRAGRDTIFLCGNDGFIARSIDGGRSWTSKAWAALGLNAISFANSKVGYAVGEVATWFGPPQRPSAAQVFVTTDGGETWRNQYSGISHWLFAVKCFDRHHVVVAGFDSYVARTEDGGDVVFNGVWKPDSSGQVQQNSLSMSFPSPAVGSVAGTSGGIIHTIDSGKTWIKQNSGVHANLNSIAFVNDSQGFAVGDSGIILHTANGGTDWVQIAPPSSTPLAVSVFPQPSRSVVQFSYSLPQVQNVSIMIYDLTGKQVRTLLDHHLEQRGDHRVQFDGSQLPAGFYEYRVQTDRYSATGKLTLTK
jgi:photosystem II stability/assembly factor-like uncharacterized protein